MNAVAGWHLDGDDLGAGLSRSRQDSAPSRQRAETPGRRYGGSMAQVDPENDNIHRFIVRHYRYDPERRERRHVIVAAFDNEPEFQACMQEVAAEIRRRRENGENVDRREHASGSIYEPGYLRRAANGHLLSRAIRHGVTAAGLERLELPSNTSYVTAVRDEAVDDADQRDQP
jgi:hypothetical protein